MGIYEKGKDAIWFIIDALLLALPIRECLCLVCFPARDIPIRPPPADSDLACALKPENKTSSSSSSSSFTADLPSSSKPRQRQQ